MYGCFVLCLSVSVFVSPVNCVEFIYVHTCCWRFLFLPSSLLNHFMYTSLSHVIVIFQHCYFNFHMQIVSFLTTKYCLSICLHKHWCPCNGPSYIVAIEFCQLNLWFWSILCVKHSHCKNWKRLKNFELVAIGSTLTLVLGYSNMEKYMTLWCMLCQPRSWRQKSFY